MPKFSIITPNFNMVNYLPNCIASVKDQNINHEHILVDGNSNDGSIEFIKSQNHIKFIIENDNGMYDALNKGIKTAKGEYIGHLNSDEQYLPGTLQIVEKMFNKNPDVDIIHGGKININDDFSFYYFKKPYPLSRNQIVNSHLYAYTCSTFYRRRIFDEQNFFNPQLSSVGDVEFLLRIKKKYKTKHTQKLLSTFMLTGSNLSINTISKKERAILEKEYATSLSKNFPSIISFSRIIQKIILGCYFPIINLNYEIYTTSKTKRQKFKVNFASSFPSKKYFV